MSLLSALAIAGCSITLSSPKQRRITVEHAPLHKQALRAVAAPEYNLLAGAPKSDPWEGADGAKKAGAVGVRQAGAEERTMVIAGGETLAHLLERLGFDARTHPEVIAIVRSGRADAGRDYQLVSAYEDSPGSLCEYILCDVSRLLRYGDLKQDLSLVPGDQLFVPFRRSTLRAEFYASFGVLVEW